MTNPQPREQSAWPLRMLPIAFLAVGMWLTWVTAAEFHMERQSRAWPRVPGVLHIEVGEYRKNLHYQYRVDGVDYSSSRVVFGEIRNRTRSREWEAVGSRADGSAVEVFYMPGNPAESTLVAGLCASAYSNLLLGVVFLLVGAFAALLIPAGLKKIAGQAGERDTHQPVG